MIKHSKEKLKKLLERERSLREKEQEFIQELIKDKKILLSKVQRLENLLNEEKNTRPKEGEIKP